MRSFIRTNPVWALVIALLGSALLVRGLAWLWQNSGGSLSGGASISFLEIILAGLLASSVVFLTVLLIIGIIEWRKSGASYIAKLWSGAVGMFLVVVVVVTATTGFRGLSSIVDAFILWVNGNSAKVGVWANPPAGPPRRGGPITQQQPSAWDQLIEWSGGATNLLIMFVLVTLLAWALFSDKKKG